MKKLPKDKTKVSKKELIANLDFFIKATLEYKQSNKDNFQEVQELRESIKRFDKRHANEVSDLKKEIKSWKIKTTAARVFARSLLDDYKMVAKDNS